MFGYPLPFAELFCNSTKLFTSLIGASKFWANFPTIVFDRGDRFAHLHLRSLLECSFSLFVSLKQGVEDLQCGSDILRDKICHKPPPKKKQKKTQNKQQQQKKTVRVHSQNNIISHPASEGSINITSLSKYYFHNASVHVIDQED